jgi:hypothetical protein
MQVIQLAINKKGQPATILNPAYSDLAANKHARVIFYLKKAEIA